MLNIDEKTPYDNLDYQALFDTCQNCKACDLHKPRHSVVVGSGTVPNPLMFIGEGPGQDEDEQGLPFVGRAGQLLTKILDSVGIDRNKDCYIANIVKCRPPKNRTPFSTEVEACQSYLIRQIQLVKPRVLVVLGSPSLKTVLGPQYTISKVRGHWYKRSVAYMSDPLYIMPLFHPSYLLRNQDRAPGSPKWLTWHDIQEIKRALDFIRA